MGRRRHFQLTPFDLFEMYPNACYLNIIEPTPATRWGDFREDVFEDPYWDGLFAFLVDECVGMFDDASSLTRGIASAMADLRGVQAGIRRLENG